MLPFRITHRDEETGARCGELETPHGVVRTPAFMPVGTGGTVKGVAAWELERLAPEMVLANTYHLLLRPGIERIEAMGGLHRLLAWKGPILTDSGGYQVFSLAERRRLDEGGVTFRSHVDGSSHRLTPASAVEAQARFGVDVAMVLDECLAYPVEPEEARTSMLRSVDWALEGLERARQLRSSTSWRGGVFAIQQGSVDADLRRHCAELLCGHDFDGFAIGGLAVGEPPELLHRSVARAAPMLPDERPRYLMGVGYPDDILEAVGHGVDLFDCVLPTRSARTGKVFTSRGELVIKNARHADENGPLDPDCACPTCRAYSRAALRHLFVSREVTSVVLLTIHNLFHYLSLMRAVREAIMAGRYGDLRAHLAALRGPSGRRGPLPEESADESG
jgi:queuine tRNA-ribosyltransferase